MARFPDGRRLPRGVLLFLAGTLAAQSTTDVAVVTLAPGLLSGPDLRLADLGAGDGGFDQPTADAGFGFRTPGGAHVQAREQGVKVTLPNGHELLVTPSGSVALRDGSQTLPSLGALELWLADGSRIACACGPRGRPLRGAAVLHGDRELWCWPPSAAAGARNRRAPPPVRGGRQLLALGDGRTLYHPLALGPCVVLRRVLQPKGGDVPEARLVVSGAVLARTLQRLPEHVPPRPVQMPDAPAATRTLAAWAPRLFGAVAQRPARARGPIVLALGKAGAWQLVVAVRDGLGPWPMVALELRRADSEVPAVEWTVGTWTELRIVRPGGGAGGAPRYFLRGMRLDQELAALAPWSASGSERAWAFDWLRSIGG